MMRQMREATKPIMLLAALAFVALMVFEWGMDMSGRSGGSVGEIGSVNGQPVNYESYMACLLYTSPSPRDLSTSRMPSSA